MLNGPANGSPRKLSGNSPHAAAWNQSATPGVTTSGRAAGTWRIRGRECSRSAIPAKMDLQVLRRSAPFPRMDTACTTWPATYGSGAAIGIGSMPTLRRQAKMYVATLPDRLRVTIQAIPTRPSAWSRGGPSFATRHTAKVIVRALGVVRRPTPVRPIPAFGA